MAEPKEKRCKRCNKMLPITAFDKNQYNKAGDVIRRSECRKCREYIKPIPSRVRKIYEKNNPKPKKGDYFHCPICKRTLIIEKSRDVNLDHCHKTGEIRGWVCNDCNTGMGKFKDDVSVIQRAIQWLKGTLHSIVGFLQL